MSWARELRDLLIGHGADLVGFADLGGAAPGLMPYGVSVAIAIPPDVVRGIHDGPTRAYFDAYHQLNGRLDKLVTLGAEFLHVRGYQATAQTVTTAHDEQTGPNAYQTLLPHKTVATRAGLGWIGRCALLVTREFGSAVRISSILTDAPLPCDTPCDESRCGDCRACATLCPAGAVSGALWKPGMPRETLFDAFKCRETARARALDRIGETITICGKCFEVCPHTRAYLDRYGEKTGGDVQ